MNHIASDAMVEHAEPQSYTYTVQARVSHKTELAVKAAQSKKHLETGKRPRVNEMVGEILEKWADTQA